MKRLVVLLVAVGLFGATPVFAVGDMTGDEELTQCSIQADTIQQKIKKLETSIANKEGKYDANEVKKLKAKLDEANKILDQLNKN